MFGKGFPESPKEKQTNWPLGKQKKWSLRVAHSQTKKVSQKIGECISNQIYDFLGVDVIMVIKINKV